MAKVICLAGLLIAFVTFPNIPSPLSGDVDQVDGKVAAIDTKVAIKPGIPRRRIGGGTRLWEAANVSA